MYCVAEDGMKAVEVTVLYIEKGRDNGKYTIFANDRYKMAEFKTLEEAKSKLKLAVSSGTNGHYYEF